MNKNEKTFKDIKRKTNISHNVNLSSEVSLIEPNGLQIDVRFCGALAMIIGRTKVALISSGFSIKEIDGAFQLFYNPQEDHFRDRHINSY